MSDQRAVQSGGAVEHERNVTAGERAVAAGNQGAQPDFLDQRLADAGV